MAISPQELENLESFLKGTLSADDTSKFTLKLQEDRAFFEEAQSYAKLIQTIQIANPERIKVKALMKTAPRTPLVRRLRPLLSAVAALIILVLALIWLFPQSRETKEYTALGYHTEVFPMEKRDDKRSFAQSKFNAKKFAKAAQLYDQEYQKTKEKNLRFNYAVACQRAGNYPQAQLVFAELAKSEDYNHRQKAELYYALSLYLGGKVAESKNAIKAMLENEGYKRKEDVQRLLNKIEKK